MNTQREHLVTGSLWGKIALIVFMLCFVSTVSAEAAVTVRAFTGTVEVLLKGEDTWKPTSEAMELNVGDEILTGKGSSVDLLGEDGSELHLGEETQLAISELEFSVTEKTRVSRFKLVWGTVTAKAATFMFKKNTFEIETDTVVAGFKFSNLQMAAKQNEAGEQPYTKVSPLEGKFELRQKPGEGKTDVECFLKSARGGLAFSLEPNAVVNLEVDQTPGREKIGVNSDTPFQNMRAPMSDERNVLILENTDKAPLILVGFQGHTIELEENSAAWFGLPLTQAQQELVIGTNRGIAALFSFIQNPEIIPLLFQPMAMAAIQRLLLA